MSTVVQFEMYEGGTSRTLKKSYDNFTEEALMAFFSECHKVSGLGKIKSVSFGGDK